ncbi:MAG: glycerol kinase GlpK [Chloroflexi bacterium]|nr:glycerol kinase GlpK [Chloroflexota bacterium]MXV92063.1 glycerol kinase GlpK [Chloroflexota bacterium]MYH64271.1 glycerol kinase GlpK [Chloroflexota bacterium]
MAEFILALDQGTTSSRAILFDRGGRIIRSAQQEFPQIYPQPGRVEHDPRAIWQSQLAVAREVIADPADIAAIGISNQRETTLIWDRHSGAPIHNAIVWQDRRTAGFCDELKAEGFDKTILRRTGLVTDAYFSGTKVAWLLDNVPGARERAANGELAFGTVDSYLAWQLTGGRLHITDVSNAARTMLFDIHRADWSGDILARLAIPRALLPEVRPCSQVYGETDAELFGAGIPIAGMAGDQQAATFGQAAYQAGMAKNTYGTGCFMLMNTGGAPQQSANNLLSTIAWQVGDAPLQYALEGSIFMAGAAVQWLRDEMKMLDDAAESQALAESVSDTGGVYVVPAFAGLGAPYWDQYARGSIVGMTRGSGRAQIVRATLEAIAYQSRDVVAAMSADSGLPLEALRVDGGAVANDFLMQFQADILGVPVEKPAITETTALGAAYLAGLAVGFWASQAEIAGQWQLQRRFEPTMSADQRESLYAGWQRAVERARGWARE